MSVQVTRWGSHDPRGVTTVVGKKDGRRLLSDTATAYGSRARRRSTRRVVDTREKKSGKSSTAFLARGRRRSKRLRSDAAPGWGGGARRRAVARRVRRGVAAVRRSGTSALSPRTRSRAPSHAPSADRADRAAPPDAWKAQMRIILKRYRLDGPRPAAIASRAKPWIPSSRVYTRGRTWSRPHARGARCGARGGKPRRA